MAPFDKCGACHSRCSCRCSNNTARCQTSRASPTRFFVSGRSAALSSSLRRTPNSLRSSRLRASALDPSQHYGALLVSLLARVWQLFQRASSLVAPTCAALSSPLLCSRLRFSERITHWWTQPVMRAVSSQGLTPWPLLRADESCPSSPYM